MFKKLLDPNIEIKVNIFGFIAIIIASIYGLHHLILELIGDIKEILDLIK